MGEIFHPKTRPSPPRGYEAADMQLVYPSIEFVPRLTLLDNFQEETNIYDIHNLEDLTDKILEQSEVEIVMI